MVARAAVIAAALILLVMAPARPGQDSAPAPGQAGVANTYARLHVVEARLPGGYVEAALVDQGGADVPAGLSPQAEINEDAEEAVLPSISPDLISSLEEQLAPLRAVAPVVLQQCPGSAPASTATSTPVMVRTATPRSSPTPSPKATGSTTARPSTPTPARTGTRTATRTATPPATATPAVLGCVGNANVTFYDCKKGGFCGQMYNGTRVYEGAAACSFDIQLGTEFRIIGDPTGRTYRCEDRGLLKPTWVDIFFVDPADGWRWAAQVSRQGTIQVLR